MTRKKHTWTALEARNLLAWKRAGLSNEVIARRLGPGFTAKQIKAYYSARPDRGELFRVEDMKDRILTLHAEGWSNAEIGRQLGDAVGAHTIGRWLRRWGRRANGNQSEIMRSRISKRVAVQEESLTEIRDAMRRARTAAMGWPDAETRAQAHLLDLLEQHGPRTRAQLLELGCPRGNMLFLLVKRGIVLSAPAGKGTRAFIYSLAPGVGRRKPEDKPYSRSKGEHAEPATKKLGHASSSRPMITWS